ncbi:MAG: HlyD family efflux transporter periplasmic adaptor subunit [Pseudomonadota bacterium]
MNATSTRTPLGRRWALVAAVLGVAALGLWALQPRPLVVDVAQVRVGRFEQTVQEDGRLRPVQRYTVAAPLQGRLDRPMRDVGAVVRAGEVLAVLHPAPPALLDARTRAVLEQRVGAAQAALAAAQAQWQRAQLALEQARADGQRTRDLAQQRFVAPSAAEQAQRAERAADQALAAADAERQRARHALAEAQAALAHMAGGAADGPWPVRSPIDGRILKRHVDSAVPVNVGQALFEIADLAQLEAVVDVLSADALRIAVGAPATLSPGPGLPPLAARVARVDPTAFTKVSALGVEEQRVPVVLTLVEPLSQTALGDGYRVEARIVVAAQEQAVLVPGGALVRDGDGWRVLVVREGRAVARRVAVRERNADVAWVSDGVQPGETVVLYPGQWVQDGQHVRPRAAPQPAAT